MTLQEVLLLDANDALAYKRDEFELPEDRVYLDGNSLGCLTTAARLRAQEVVEQQWGRDLISSWNLHGWIDLPTQVGEKIARLIGAAPGQTICCDSVSVNLFKLLGAALSLQADRSVILSQADNFPTDLYMVQGLEQLLGTGRCRLKTCAAKDLEESLDDTVAVLMLTHVNFRSGAVHDMRRLTQSAHQKGILVLWDLAHSAGVLSLEMDKWQVDFAVGCGYKYLHGGPGAPAFLYVAQRHLANVRQPLTGWMGHEAPFQFTESYQGSAGIAKFLTGTPPVVSMSVLDAALDVFTDVEIEQLREKSMALSELFLKLLEENPDLFELRLLSPRCSNERGAQLAFTHPHAYAISQALIAHGVIADFRAPDILRFGFSPLFLRFQDIWKSVEILATVMGRELWRDTRFAQTEKVT